MGASGTTSTATRSATSGGSSSGGIRDVASRLAGSTDLYADDGRSPYASVNFVTAHDGFTLRDLVSYDHKHNEANGEDNRDGTDNNRSWNCGVEGETDDPAIIALRRKQAANLMATLCLSTGVPMITAGDERGRTQRGNNNAYGQDNEISWVDWRPDDAWLDIYEIAKTALRLRREHPALRQRHFLEGRPTVDGGPKDLAWIHPEGREMTERRLVRRQPAHVRDVRLRRPAARPRPARRAAARRVVPAVVQRARRAGQGHAPGERVGAAPARSCSAPTPSTRSARRVAAGEVIDIEPALADRAPPALSSSGPPLSEPVEEVAGVARSSSTSLIQRGRRRHGVR